jgi:hypothetical protein
MPEEGEFVEAFERIQRLLNRLEWRQAADKCPGRITLIDLSTEVHSLRDMVAEWFAVGER